LTFRSGFGVVYLSLSFCRALNFILQSHLGFDDELYELFDFLDKGLLETDFFTWFLLTISIGFLTPTGFTLFALLAPVLIEGL